MNFYLFLFSFKGLTSLQSNLEFFRNTAVTNSTWDSENLNFSFKSCSNFKSRESFGICSSYCGKKIGSMWYPHSFINLQESFTISSVVLDLEYLGQNIINFNMYGVFWKDKQIPKLPLDFQLEKDLKEKFRFFTVPSAVCSSCMKSTLKIFPPQF